MTIDEDGTARLWDASSGQPVGAFKGRWSSIVDAVFSPDGKTIATACYDGTVRLYSTEVEYYVRKACEILRNHPDYFRQIEADFLPLLTTPWCPGIGDAWSDRVSSTRPPLPNSDWSMPEAEQDEVERTRQRLDQTEANEAAGKDVEETSDRARSMLLPQPPADWALLCSARPLVMASADGGTWRRQMERLRRQPLWLTAAGAIVGVGLGLAAHVHGGPLMGTLGGGGLGLVAVLLLRRLEAR